LLIKFLQDAAGKGDLDPWDIDVISVIDSFLEQYSQTFGENQIKKVHITRIYLRLARLFLRLPY